ncbi:hypothetical protein TNCV_3116141 [Trichonephila clavipes]|nr:hypothetical protein TNCV_3116141 [Trichonephila clavipes]
MRICLGNFCSSLKRTCLYSCGVLQLHNIQSFLLDAVKGHARLDAGRKDQSLQDGCRLFSWKFFQTQQQGHKQAEEPFPAYAVVHSTPSSDPL